MNENLKNDWFVELNKTEFVNLDKNVSNNLKNTTVRLSTHIAMFLKF